MTQKKVIDQINKAAASAGYVLEWEEAISNDETQIYLLDGIMTGVKKNGSIYAISIITCTKRIEIDLASIIKDFKIKKLSAFK